MYIKIKLNTIDDNTLKNLKPKIIKEFLKNKLKIIGFKNAVLYDRNKPIAQINTIPNDSEVIIQAKY